MVRPCMCFFYASNAIDRVNILTLLLKLESRGLPTSILRLLSNELIGQYTGVRWGSTHSECVLFGNAVKQGVDYHPSLLTYTW